MARRRFLEVGGHTDRASLDAWQRLALPLYTRTPRDPDMARRAVIRSEVLRWFTKPDGESHTFNTFPDLGRIQCPTLVLGGEDDPIHPIESQADIAAALPAHLVQFERFAKLPACGGPRCARTCHGGDPGLHRTQMSQAAKTKPAPEGTGERLF
jgi:pimeloyl-ACP methyl ester carboxylesterase